MKIHHVALAVTDLAAAEAFYVGVLGLTVLSRGERSLWLDLDGAILMLELEGRAGGPHCLALAIAPSERAAWRARLGAALEAESRHTLYARDPFGNRIGLSHYPAPE
ncbi:MAG TPA: VOC family protein [Haliangiales bacterium]|nr:VOC family protein [Haliangiales bacterium]